MRNRADGSVEARLVARPDALEVMLGKLRRGPPHAVVRELRIAARGASAAESGFRVEATFQ